MTEKQKVATNRNWYKGQLANSRLNLAKLRTFATNGEIRKIDNAILILDDLLSWYDSNSIHLGVKIKSKTLCTKCKLLDTSNKSGICTLCRKESKTVK